MGLSHGQRRRSRRDDRRRHRLRHRVDRGLLRMRQARGRAAPANPRDQQVIYVIKLHGSFEEVSGFTGFVWRKWRSEIK